MHDGERTRLQGSLRGVSVSVGGVGVHSRGSAAVAVDTGAGGGTVSRGGAGGALTVAAAGGETARSKSNDRGSGSRGEVTGAVYLGSGADGLGISALDGSYACGALTGSPAPN